MRFHSQNLNEKRQGEPNGPMFWHGRAWLYRRSYDELVHVEWLFGKYARDFAVTATFGYGDSDAGICFHLCIPWLFSWYLVLPYVYRCHESMTGIGIHNGSFWIYPLADQHESRRDHPWWKKNYCFDFPWTYQWESTEILEHKSNLPGFAKTVFLENRSDRKRDPFEVMRIADTHKKAVSETYDYVYRLKNGQTQIRQATVFVERRTWRMKWWPLLPFRKFRTSIDVRFSDEVGEGTGSWKGGCTGCGYDMLFGETPLECLRRMERERKFDR